MRRSRCSGTPAEVGEAILRVKEVCGYDDFMFHTWFESGGFSAREVEEQMQAFAEEVCARAAPRLWRRAQAPRSRTSASPTSGPEQLERVAAEDRGLLVSRESQGLHLRDGIFRTHR